MPFGVMSGVGRGMGVLDGVHMPQGKGGLGSSLPIGLNGVFQSILKTEMYLTRV